MKEGLNRRDVLKGIVAAGALAATPETAEASKNAAETVRSSEVERAAVIKREIDEVARLTNELGKAFKSGDKEREMQIRQELGERFERTQRLLNDSLK